MKTYNMFVCETCGFESKDQDAMMEHEAAHLGLTSQEMKDYNSMKSFIYFLKGKMDASNSGKIRSELEKAENKLKNFEIEHNLHH